MKSTVAEALPSGDILVIGENYEVNLTGTDMLMLEYRPDGTLDPTFANNGIALISLGAVADSYAYTMMPSGEVLVDGIKLRDHIIPRPLTPEGLIEILGPPDRIVPGIPPAPYGHHDNEAYIRQPWHPFYARS